MMINKMINIFHVGAHLCVRPGRHAGLPLRLILCVFFITGLTACKVDFSIFGSGTVQSASPSIDCVGTGTYDGNGNPIMTGDCTQTYNVDENNVACSGANCTVVTDTITETYTATPVQDDTFDGFAGHCSGAGPCVKEITESEANVDQLVTAEVHFDPEAVPQDATYTYNYLGQRASKTVNSVTTYYIYDEQGNMLSEIDSSGNSIKDYIYMDGEYIAHVEQTGDTGSSETQEQLFYPLNDHLGQSFMVMRADEKFSHEQYTTPFGQMHAQFVDANVGTGPLKQNRRFPGQYYDAESGYAQNWMREYDSSTGSYVESDPIGQLYNLKNVFPNVDFGPAMKHKILMENGPNYLYSYAMNNPIMREDPSGLWSIICVLFPSFCNQTLACLDALEDAYKRATENGENLNEGDMQRCRGCVTGAIYGSAASGGKPKDTTSAEPYNQCECKKFKLENKGSDNCEPCKMLKN